MIKILHIVNSMNVGGLETFIMNMYRNIDREKIQFEFLVHTEEEAFYDKEILELGGKIHQITSRSKSFSNNIQDLNQFFSRNDYLIVHQHVSSLSYIEPLKIAKKYNVPYRILHSHSVNQSGSKLHLLLHSYHKKRIVNYATEFFACSENAANWTFPKEIIDNQEYYIINNGIDSDKYKFNSKKRIEIRKYLNIEENDFLLGHVGRFDPVKNHKFILDVFKEIVKKKPNSYLLLIGDGKYKKEIIEKINQLGLENHIFLLGIKMNVHDYFQAMDYFIFPSKYEGLGIVLIESQASGLKSITSENRVPNDVNVTNLVKYFNLSKSASEWSSEILKDLPYKRINRVDTIKESKLDVAEVSTFLSNYYTNILK